MKKEIIIPLKGKRFKVTIEECSPEEANASTQVGEKTIYYKITSEEV